MSCSTNVARIADTTLLIVGDMCKDTTFEAIRQLTEIHQRVLTAEITRDITIILSSTGGITVDALALADFVSMLDKFRPVTMIATGQVGSCALFPFLSASIRLCTENAEFLYHDMSYEGGYATTGYHESYVEYSKGLRNRLKTLLMTKTGIPNNTISRTIDEKSDLRLTAEQADLYGLVRSVITEIPRSLSYAHQNIQVVHEIEFDGDSDKDTSKDSEDLGEPLEV